MGSKNKSLKENYKFTPWSSIRDTIVLRLLVDVCFIYVLSILWSSPSLMSSILTSYPPLSKMTLLCCYHLPLHRSSEQCEPRSYLWVSLKKVTHSMNSSRLFFWGACWRYTIFLLTLSDIIFYVLFILFCFVFYLFIFFFISNCNII